MKKSSHLVAFCLLFALSCNLSHADQARDIAEKNEIPWTFSFYFENDLFANTDRNYTNGTKFSLISGDLTNYIDAQVLPDFIYNASRWLPFINKEGIQRNIALSIGQNIYTPNDTQDPNLIPNDRPYAAWLYFGIAFHNKTPRWMDVIEVNFGVVGPMALGEEIQNFVHKVRSIKTAKGWDNQIRNEPVINLIWERKWKFALLNADTGFGIDSILHTGASLGNLFTYGNAGATLRVGWNLPTDFGAAVIRAAGDTNSPIRVNDERFSLHLFSGFDGRLVLRDLTLDGNTWRSSHSVEREDWVYDLSVGIGLNYGKWKISYAQVFRSPTFKLGLRQAFGSINISRSF